MPPDDVPGLDAQLDLVSEAYLLELERVEGLFVRHGHQKIRSVDREHCIVACVATEPVFKKNLGRRLDELVHLTHHSTQTRNLPHEN